MPRGYTELALPLMDAVFWRAGPIFTAGSTWESRPYTSPRQHSRVSPDGWGVGELDHKVVSVEELTLPLPYCREVMPTQTLATSSSQEAAHRVMSSGEISLPLTS